MPDSTPKRNENPTFLASFLSGCVRQWQAMSHPRLVLTQDVPAEALALGRSRQGGLKSLGKKGSSQ
jgi:hypothetical protein